MDWSKAKSILIIALIITNSILFGFNLYNKYMTKDLLNTKKFIEETQELLEKRGIKIDCTIPRYQDKLPSLRVEFENYNPISTNEIFFKSKGTVESPNSTLTQINYKNNLITIINNRRIRYESSGDDEVYNLKNFDDAKKIAEEFLIKNKFDTDDMELTHTEKLDGNYYLNYSKVYEGIIVERSYTNLIVNNTGIVLMDRLWLNVTDTSSSNIKLISASKALLSLLDENEYYNRTIKSIEICYYFDPEAQGYVEDITKAEQGRAIPAWRIQFDDGENIEIDNF